MTDLVVISLESWDEVWRRNQHLVAGLLRNTSDLRVLFIEPATDPLHALRSRARPTFGRGLTAISIHGGAGRLWAYQGTKWLPRRIDRATDHRRALRIKRLAARLHFEQPVLWVNDPAGADVLEVTNWRALYDITDDWLVADRPERARARLEAQERVLLHRCQEIVVCSQNLLLGKAAEDRSPTLIPNGVDVAAYRRAHGRPRDLPAGSTAVYVGTLHRDRLDVDLCVATAHRLGQEGTLALVGPNALGQDDVRVLRRAGVELLGSKPSAEVPAYLQHAEVLVVPHVISAFTESLDPIKAYEYRAAGRPVIATDVPGFREDATSVEVAAPRDFPERVADLIGRRIPTTAPVGVPDWSDRVREFAAVIERVKA